VARFNRDGGGALLLRRCEDGKQLRAGLGADLLEESRLGVHGRTVSAAADRPRAPDEPPPGRLLGAFWAPTGLPKNQGKLPCVHATPTGDPLSYAVDPMRRAVFAHASVSGATQHALNPGITCNGWRLPTGLELGLVLLLGSLMLSLAIARFSKTE
jgi:hypothetical protein